MICTNCFYSVIFSQTKLVKLIYLKGIGDWLNKIGWDFLLHGRAPGPLFPGGYSKPSGKFPKVRWGGHTWILALSTLDTTLALAATTDVFYLLICLLRKLGVGGGSIPATFCSEWQLQLCILASKRAYI